MATIAEYVAQLLNDNGIAYYAPTGSQWKLYYSKLPSTPDKAVSVFATGGDGFGRFMKTGETIFMPTIQVRVRAIDVTEAEEKALAVKAFFDTVVRRSIVLNLVPKVIQAITVYTYPVFIGQDQDKNRSNYVLNARISFAE